MRKPVWGKMTYEDFMSRLSVDKETGCWIYPYSTREVMLNGQRAYIIPLIFEHYNKPYMGKITRTCNNKSCFNPDHICSLTAVERFWSNIDIKGDDDCWEWKSRRGTSRYGETRICGQSVKAHRVSYELAYGSIPDGMLVCHRCDNPPCCNPKHLFLGTTQDNIDDRELKGRNKLPYCRGEQHGHHKLTEADVRTIRSLYASGVRSYVRLGRMYNMTFGAIRNVIKRRTWGWLE